MKKILLISSLLVVLTSCKKDLTTVYPKGTMFNFKAGPLTDLNQPGNTVNIEDARWHVTIRGKVDSLATFTPVGPFTIDTLSFLANANAEENRYWVHSANFMYYDMPQSDIKPIKQ